MRSISRASWLSSSRRWMIFRSLKYISTALARKSRSPLTKRKLVWSLNTFWNKKNTPFLSNFKILKALKSTARSRLLSLRLKSKTLTTRLHQSSRESWKSRLRKRSMRHRASLRRPRPAKPSSSSCRPRQRTTIDSDWSTWQRNRLLTRRLRPRTRSWPNWPSASKSLPSRSNVNTKST